MSGEVAHLDIRRGALYPNVTRGGGVS